MIKERSSLGAGGARSLWAVLGVLLLGVLVPTGCVLWFMNAAMRNEHLAVRQKLIDVYNERLISLRSDLEPYWDEKVAGLDEGRGLSAPERFAKLVRSGAVESVVVYDEKGELAYPVLTYRVTDANEDASVWENARTLEYELEDPNEAATAYAKIAAVTRDVNVKAQGLQAQARCLVKSGRKEEAIKALSVLGGSENLRQATDSHGRLIALNAAMLAIQLLDDSDDPESRRLAQLLVERLNEYGAPPVPPTQRVFLMLALQETVPAMAEFPTLQAERLSARYLSNLPKRPSPLRLTRTGPGELWSIASEDSTLVAIFREETLLTEMKSAAALDESFAGAAFSLAAPGEDASRTDAFLSAPAPETMPGWTLQVRLVGEDPFAAAARRQTVGYLWTAAGGIGIIILLGLILARYISRQMRLTRMKNDFIATVSHELKTPLTSMRVLVDTLLEGRCEDETTAREYLQLVARENERLSRLIDNFLTFSRMERNKKVFDLAALRVEDVITAGSESVSDRFRKGGYELSIEVAPDLPLICGDHDFLTTALVNLLDNAYKYSKDDKHIALRAYADRGSVCLEVVDRGVGMPRKTLRKIFDRFYQADRTLSRGAEGCGLGLSIVKFIVDAHGGTIDVESTYGKGSTFIMRVPACDGSTAAATAQEQR